MTVSKEQFVILKYAKEGFDMDFRSFLKNELVLLDGAMGTQIQKKGLILGALPETINLENPELLKEIHASYVQAGSHVVSTNTFGASAYKLSETQLSVEEVVTSAVDCAKRSGAKYVALDLGPVGRLMKPLGDMTFDEAYEAFKEQVIYGQKADVVLIETLSDLNEARAAVLAVKENSTLPVIVSMTFGEDGRTLTGVTPECFVYTLEALGVDGIGVNCSLGPKELMPIIERLTSVATVPVIVQANAGLPVVTNGVTTFSYNPDMYAPYIEKFIALGVSIIGGCCGTGPEHIKKIASLIEESEKVLRENTKIACVCSQTQVHHWDKFMIIGERINPTGNKKLKMSLRSGNISDCVREAIEQTESGAHILDVNVGLPDIDELKIMGELVAELSAVVPLPLQIDSSKSRVVEQGLRHFPGVGIVNSLNGKQKSMDKIFPIVKKYGAMVVCLTLDEAGIPKSAEERVMIAEKIIGEAKKYGISEERLIIDCLVLTVSAQQKEVMETVKAINIITSKYAVQTTLGISNVSYGMPNRKLLTRTFMTLALSAGLNSAIMDPLDQTLRDTILASEVLLNHDVDGENYIAGVSDQVSAPGSIDPMNSGDLFSLVIKGYKKEVKAFTKLKLASISALDIVNEYLVPTLDKVGLQYESKHIFLPQLIRAAETIGVAFDVIKDSIEETSESVSKGTIVMATVKGDVHDIGKNLVKILLENYGYDIIDLGKDVSAETIVKCVVENNIGLVGLSALMTTTVISMAETIKQLNEFSPNTKIFVGGAVLTASYANSINADYYCKDAKASVVVAQEFFADKTKNQVK